VRGQEKKAGERGGGQRDATESPATNEKKERASSRGRHRVSDRSNLIFVEKNSRGLKETLRRRSGRRWKGMKRNLKEGPSVWNSSTTRRKLAITTER